MTLSDAYELRSRLRPLAATPRVRDCGARAICEAPELVVRDYKEQRRAWWEGILRCGRQFACPVCAAKRAAERAAELDRLMLGDEHGRWQMVTFTLRHHRGESLRSLLDKLYGAWRKVRSRRVIRKIFDEHVTASVRAVEVTHGKNGWHPHIHLLLRTSHWSDAERARLQWEWLSVLPGVAGVAVVWSAPLQRDGASRARYLSKLGAEVAGVAKTPKCGNATPWQIARAALVDPPARELWTEYQRAMRGRRVLEFDERAKAMLAPEADADEHLREWRVPFTSDEFRALASFERHVPTILYEVIETAVHGGPDPPSVVTDAVFDVLRWGSQGGRSVVRARPRSLDLEISFVRP